MPYRRSRRKYGRRLVRRRRPSAYRRRRSRSRVSRRPASRRRRPTKRVRSIRRTNRRRKAVSKVARVLCAPIRKCVREMFPKASVYLRTSSGVTAQAGGLWTVYQTGADALTSKDFSSATLPFQNWGSLALTSADKAAGYITCPQPANRALGTYAEAKCDEQVPSFWAASASNCYPSNVNLSQFAFPRMAYSAPGTATPFTRTSNKANVHLVSNKHRLVVTFPALPSSDLSGGCAILAQRALRLDFEEVVYWFKDHTTMQTLLYTDGNYVPPAARTDTGTTLAQMTTRQHNLLRLYNASFVKHPKADNDVSAPTITALANVFDWSSAECDRFRTYAPKKDRGQFLAAGLADLRKQFKVVSRKKRTFRRRSSFKNDEKFINGAQVYVDDQGTPVTDTPDLNEGSAQALPISQQSFMAGMSIDFKGRTFNWRNNAETLPRGAYFYCQYARVYSVDTNNCGIAADQLPYISCTPVNDSSENQSVPDYALHPGIEYQLSWAPQFQSNS